MAAYLFSITQDGGGITAFIAEMAIFFSEDRPIRHEEPRTNQAAPKGTTVQTGGVQGIPFTIVGQTLHPLRGRAAGKRRKNVAAASARRAAGE